MPSLLERLESIKTGQVESASGTMAVAQLVEQAKKLRQQHPELTQQKISFTANDLADFVRLLVAFDGWCQAIYLCPPNVAAPEVTDLIQWPNSDQSMTIQATNNLSHSETVWFMATSGTTGQPKWYPHTLAALSSGLKQSDSLQALSWGLLYQAYRYAGLQVVLQALLSGANLVDASEYSPIEQIARLQQFNVNALSATPSLWRQLLMTPQCVNLGLKIVTLGGEIADQRLLNHLDRCFPKAKIRHIYASTEAGVGFVVADKKAGFPASWLHSSTTQPIALKLSETGHLLLKTAGKSNAMQTDDEGYLDSMDSVEVIDDRVHFLGRVTGVINVGGNKVHPEKVEQVLMMCSDVQQAKVYAKKNPVMGALVAADIVTTNVMDENVLKLSLMNLCKQHLERFELPSSIKVVDALASATSGKLDRKQHD